MSFALDALHWLQPGAQKIRSDWLPSFMLSYFFAYWFYARHLEGNYATLIFQATEKIRPGNFMRVAVKVDVTFLGR
jgi:hypothetical protein